MRKFGSAETASLIDLRGWMLASSHDLFFFSSRRRHTRFDCDWSSDVCSSDLDQHVFVEDWAGADGDVEGGVFKFVAPLWGAIHVEGGQDGGAEEGKNFFSVAGGRDRKSVG